ncbi:unnamed protein product, partial [Heterotrigona itama]
QQQQQQQQDSPSYLLDLQPSSSKRKLRSCRERMIRCAHSRAFPLCYFRAESPFEALNRTVFPTKKAVYNINSTCWSIAEHSP